MQQVRKIPRDEYAAIAREFTAERFDAGQWVDAFQQAGQRYLIVTSKHHDGFCLFDSQHTDFTTTKATPFGRDAIAELADACRERNMPFGVYYSQTQDWHHPDGHGNDWDFDPQQKNFDAYIEGYVKPQVEELLTNYGPLAVLWFDTPMIMTPEQSRSLLDLVHRLQPACLVNGRVGHGMGDYANSRDNQRLAQRPTMDWECCATMSQSWGFKPDDEWKSVDYLVDELRHVTNHGGNYLLNVGPEPSGALPPEAIERLQAIGRRLREEGHPGDASA